MILLVCLAVPGCLFRDALAQHSYKEERAAENFIVEAVADISSGRTAEAQKRLEFLLAKSPDNDAAHYYMALVLTHNGDYDAAEKHFKEAVRLNRGNFWYRYRLASLYAMTDRQELTEDLYVGLLKDFPKESEIYLDLIGIYASQNKMDLALETLDRIETVFGKTEGTAMTRFEILHSTGKTKEAYEALEAYNSEYSSPQILALLGDRNMSIYNDSTALAMYDEALDIAPDFAPALLGKAETLRLTRRYAEYFSTIQEFLASKDVNSKGKADYLKALSQRMDPNFLQTFRENVDSMFSTAVGAHPSDSLLLTAAAIYYYSTERGEKALDCLRKNMECWPESVSATANYMELLAYQSKWEELSACAEAAYGHFPGESGFLEMSVLADYNLKNDRKVIETCKKIIDTSPLDSAKVLMAYSTMGDMYHASGDNAKAYKCYEKALKLNAGYTPVLNNYAYYLCIEGKKLKKAAAMSRKTIEKEPDNPTYLDTYGWILHLQGKNSEAKPVFKHAMLYGGRDNAVILDHYAEVLYALGEYDTAFVYWNQALAKNSSKEIKGLEEKINARKSKIER